MSGLEIPMLIAGIVSAFTAVVNTVRNVRKKRRQSLPPPTKAAENALITTLETGPTSINNEYTRDLARLGSAFKQGDGKRLSNDSVLMIDISSASLVNILLDMNKSLLEVINHLVDTGNFIFSLSQYGSWEALGARSTNRTVTALAQLYQRKLQAASFPRAKIKDTYVPPWKAKWGLTTDQYSSFANEEMANGYGPVYVSASAFNNTVYHSAIWAKSAYIGWETRWNMSATDYWKRTQEFIRQGKYPVCISGYLVYNEVYYTAIWAKRPAGAVCWTVSGVTSEQLQELFDKYSSDGLQMTCLDGYDHKGTIKYSAVWESPADAFCGPNVWGYSGTEFTKKLNESTAEGYIPVHVSVVVVNGVEYYAGIWDKSRGRGWSMRGSMNSKEIQDEADSKIAEGYRPRVIQGYSADDGVKYASTWIKE
jgi:hypothetical protein